MRAPLELLLLAACAGGGDTGDPTPADTAGDTGAARDLVLPGAEYASVSGFTSSATGNTVALTSEAAVVAAPFGGLTCAFALPLAAGAHPLESGACVAQEADLDYAGWALDARGDANGDGALDLLVGAVGRDEGGTDAGKAYLLYGPLPGIGGSLADAPVAWTGEAALDYGGSATVFADVDGDGDSDVLLGAQNNGAGGITAGRAYLFRAPFTPGRFAFAEADVTITGVGPAEAPPPHGAPALGDGLGSVLANAGDVDGDGLDDILVGANGADDGGADSGAAGLFLGPLADGDHTFREADRLWIGGTTLLYVGDSVAAAGDVDGDGYGDVMVGGDSGGPGAVWLVRGPGVAGTVDIATAETTIVGEAPGTFAGAYTAAAGDVDGDGWPDVLVGAYGLDLANYNEGGAYLLRGPFARGTLALADLPARWVGAEDGAVVGSAVAGGADGDGDGLPDLLIGARFSPTYGDYAGEAYLVVP